MTDIRQTQAYANYLTKIGWKVERIAETNYFIKKILLGAIIKIQRPEEMKISKIKELAKKYRAFQIIVEPKTELDAKYLTSLGFKPSRSPFLPTKTLLLDLTQTREKIFRGFKKDARSGVKKGEGLEIHKVSPERFRSAWKKSVGLRRYIPSLKHLLSLKKSFKNNSLFLMTEDGSAGAIFLIGDNIAYYWQAFTNKKGRKNLEQYKIVWEGILWAKALGAKVFDFEGIFDERYPERSWLGFTHFKKSFGGSEIEYPGCFSKTNWPNIFPRFRSPNL